MAFLNAMNGVLTSVYPGEVFPTEVRGIGTGFASAVSRLGAATGTFLIPVGIATIGISPVVLIIAAIVASGAIVSQLWAPETKGKSLSETAATFGRCKPGRLGQAGCERAFFGMRPTVILSRHRAASNFE
jgi:MFS transporter, putative metabolite transport protein